MIVGGTTMKKILLLILLIICLGIAGQMDFDTEVRKGGAVLDNGNRIEMATVIDVTEDEVVVEIGNDVYVFYGNGFSKGNIITVEITKHDEIIDAY